MKNAIGLFAALCLALIVAFFVYFFQKNASKHAQENAEKVDMVMVLVAATPLKSGDRAERNKFEWAPWPKNSLQSDYIRKDKEDDIKVLDGAIVRGLVLKAEPIKKGDLVIVGDKSAMTAFVRPGMRAESIPLTKVANPSFHYAPGDYLDVIFAKRSASGVEEESIIRGVRIIAVDEKFAPQDKPDAKIPKNNTLELTPAQSASLADALRDGNITISHYSAFSPPGTHGQEHFPEQQPVTQSLRKEAQVEVPDESITHSDAGIKILRGDTRK
jgi:Flp pilus assembly protein CpaB